MGLSLTHLSNTKEDLKQERGLSFMKQKLMSLRVRMLLPVIFMTLFVVILLTVLFSRAYINMILRQENDVNAVGFETVSHSIPPLISSSVSEVQRIMADDRVAAYARLQYA